MYQKGEMRNPWQPSASGVTAVGGVATDTEWPLTLTLTTINCPRANNRVFPVNSPYHWWRKTAFLAI